MRNADLFALRILFCSVLVGFASLNAGFPEIYHNDAAIGYFMFDEK